MSTLLCDHPDAAPVTYITLAGETFTFTFCDEPIKVERIAPDVWLCRSASNPNKRRAMNRNEFAATFGMTIEEAGK